MTTGVLSSSTAVGPYMIRQALARGGMATVYYATGADGHDEVALKVSRFAETDRRYGNALRFEADLLEKLDHPNIVTIKPIPLPGAKIPPFSAKALQIRGHPWYYSMELLRGGSLLTYTEHSAALPVDAVVSMFYQVARGLMYLHRKGYAHLDVKAENVLFKYPLRKGALIQPVLVDFGVSAQTSRGMEAAGGTLLIMAPERLTAQQNSLRDMDAAKLDVYAMGITMYRVLAGRYPFTGFSQRALITAILNDPVRPLSEVRPDIPEGISALVMACLEKDHTSRPAMGHVVAQLERLPYRLSRLNRDLAR